MNWFPLTEHWYWHVGAVMGFGAGVTVGFVMAGTYYIHSIVNKMVMISAVIAIAFGVGLAGWYGGQSAALQACVDQFRIERKEENEQRKRDPIRDGTERDRSKDKELKEHRRDGGEEG